MPTEAAEPPRCDHGACPTKQATGRCCFCERLAAQATGDDSPTPPAVLPPDDPFLRIDFVAVPDLRGEAWERWCRKWDIDSLSAGEGRRGWIHNAKTYVRGAMWLVVIDGAVVSVL